MAYAAAVVPRRRAATVRRLERATGALASAAIARMDDQLPWYRAMPPDNRSWVGLVAQAGIAAFVEWFRTPDRPQAITADVFGTAPRELTRAVTLQQTVELVRVVIAIVEEQVDELAAPGEEPMLREAVLKYSREVAFAAAQVYAQAAEARGAWDARLEALVVDALLRGEADEAVRSRAAALGWGSPDSVVVVAGTVPHDDPEAVVDDIQRGARHARLDVLAGVHGDRLIAILGGVDDPVRAARALAGQFGPGAVVVGPTVPDLMGAADSARSAVAGLRAVAAWPDAPRPVLADDLLPERVLAGDEEARRLLVEEVYRPLVKAGAVLHETVSAYLEQSSSLEAAARLLYVHPNTVRYRLRRVEEVTGLTAGDPRAAYALRVALALGRLRDSPDL
ncbi:MAG: PucR family transcriptional regulator [Actinomycetes bacterium]